MAETVTAPGGKFTCRCCGHRALAAPSPSWLTCPICYWTDVAIETLADQEALFVAQRSYRRDGVSSPAWRGEVRAPLVDEAVDETWRPLDGVDEGGPGPRERAGDEVVAQIERAFAEVPAAGRTTLREAYRADHYGHEPDLEWDDHDVDWRAIPSEVLAYFERTTGPFTFGNLAGFRYYLPAYMRRAVRERWSRCATTALDRALAPGTDPRTLEEVVTLTPPQREAVVGFLRFVVAFDGPDPAAARALERIWGPVIAAPA